MEWLDRQAYSFILFFMGRNSLFVMLAALPFFACDSASEVDVEFRANDGQANKAKKAKNGKKAKRPKKAKRTYPGLDWQLGVPEAHGLSSEGLANMAAIAGQHDTSCLVVVRDGVIVGEWYWDGYDANTPIADVWSVTKSVTSAAIGVADAEGLLDIHDAVADYLPQWQGGPSQGVTIFDLITHTSGREWDFFSDFAIFDAPDQTGYSLAFGQDLEPGERWDYSNLGVQTLEAVLKNAIGGGDIEQYYQTKVFEPIGMSATLGRDLAGNPQTYRGLSATCRELARFGYLYARGGRWKGQQVVPKAWIEESTVPSTDLNAAYGYLWWLNNWGDVVLPSIPERGEFTGKMFPSAPDELYMGLGAFGQLLAVDPDAEIVVVRLTDDFDFSDPLAMGKMDDILGALEDAKIDDGCPG